MISTYSNKTTVKAPTEVAIDPKRPIIDTHHHLWHRAGYRYLLDEFRADLECGHNLVGTVYIEGSAAIFVDQKDGGVMYRPNGPKEMRPLGEVEFANGVAAMAASGQCGQTAVAAGIVGYVELLDDPVTVAAALEAQAHVSRFRGVRYHVGWHEDTRIKNPDLATWKGMLYDEKIRASLREVERLGLAFDVALLFTQLEDFHDLARAHPQLKIVLDHCGSPAVSGPYEGKGREVYAHWRTWVEKIAELPNVTAKLGGLGKPRNGLLSEDLGSEAVAEVWRPYMETSIDLFGPDRCTFESNFPVDGMFVPYNVVWNAYKRITSAYSEDEKHEMFFGTATRLYDLDLTTADRASV
ncbi:MAG: hypothetical protein ABS76_07505 [Pelagibacterium sp. SCN 64-44]|nr:MAG: hypothetical protein ABS76_07505 [Pelagibacterium sp. SCN 64-44]